MSRLCLLQHRADKKSKCLHCNWMLGKQNCRKHQEDNGILSLRKPYLIIGEMPLTSMGEETTDLVYVR